MKIGFKASFQIGALNSEFYIELFKKWVKFTPYSFRKNHITKSWDEKRHLKALAKISEEENFGIMSDAGDLFSVNVAGSNNPHRTVTFIQEKGLFDPQNIDVEKVIRNLGFIAAYMYDEGFEEVQSTPYSNNYSQKNYPPEILNSINNTPYVINEFGEKEYDVSGNPGKMDLIGYCWLMAGWKMWFGELFFEIVPKDRILTFPKAYKIEEFSNGIIFVQLFENVEESANKESMERQKAWREWLDFQGLIEKYK